jgi:hypothetical protein
MEIETRAGKEGLPLFHFTCIRDDRSATLVG